MGLSRRKFTREFKLAAIQRLEMGASVAGVARAFEVNPNLLHRCRHEFREGPGNAFPGLGKRHWEEGRGGAERWVGSCRRKLLDHMIVFSQAHLRRLVREYLRHYHADRTHDGLGKDTPEKRPVERREPVSAKW